MNLNDFTWFIEKDTLSNLLFKEIIKSSVYLSYFHNQQKYPQLILKRNEKDEPCYQDTNRKEPGGIVSCSFGGWPSGWRATRQGGSCSSCTRSAVRLQKPSTSPSSPTTGSRYYTRISASCLQTNFCNFKNPDRVKRKTCSPQN